MSGESTARAAAVREPLERVFGARATCNACGATVADYRVVALFLHETAVVRAYCEDCYPDATDGEYHAGGDGLILDYTAFAARFGAPGPQPPAVTPVDRTLSALMRDPALRALSPPNEAFARKRSRAPYAVRAAFALEGQTREASFTLALDGRMDGLTGDRLACAHARELAGV